MSDRALAANLIAAAARTHLQPIGMRRKGRSRLWFSDEGWWLINVEFQPSRSTGTYLNVGAMWLWHERDFRSFDYGSRLHWRRDGTFADRPPTGEPGWVQFLDYFNADHFSPGIELVAKVARARVDQLRTTFPNPCATSHLLASQHARPGEDQTWRTYDAGAAAALCGDAATARLLLSHVTADELDTDWVRQRADTASRLAQLAHDPPTLQRRIHEMINAARRRFALPPVAFHTTDRHQHG